MSSVSLVPSVSFYASKFFDSLRSTKQTYYVLALFESTIGVLVEQANRLGISKWVGRLRNAQGVLGKATTGLVITKLPLTALDFWGSLTHYKTGSEKESSLKKVGYDAANFMEDCAYTAIFMNMTTLIQLGSKTLLALTAVANVAAFCYDVLDLTKIVAGLGLNFLPEAKSLEKVILAKTILHLAIDVMGVLAATFGLTLISMTTLLSMTAIYLIVSIGTHVYGQVLAERGIALIE